MPRSSFVENGNGTAHFEVASGARAPGPAARDARTSPSRH